jgi:hypothetical protein
MVKRSAILICCLSMAGCAIEPSQRAQRVLPAYPEMVTNCAFLGGVTGTTKMLPYGPQYAKFKAQDEAAELGATHIVWQQITNDPRPVASGRAYYCDPKKSPAGSYEYMEDYLRMYRYPYDKPE